jgi:membrane associated rhomboid family serine protease
VFLPFRDDNPVHETPVVSWALIGICIAVFLYQSGLAPQAMRDFVLTYGFIPASFFEGAARPVQAEIAPSASLFTSMFLHGDFMHLAGNMLYLWIFADNIEAAMGKLRFIMFYVLCGLIAALAHGMLTPGSAIPMIGASGAISGVLGAYLLMYPKANVRVFMWLWIFIRVISVPAGIVLGLWFLMQFLGAANAGDGPGVAFAAHIGGFVAGMVLVKPFLRRGETLFHERHSMPWETRSVKREDTQFSETRKRKGPWGYHQNPWDKKGPWQ